MSASKQDAFMMRPLLQALVARLPELEWSLRRRPGVLNPKRFPLGLFREHLEMNVDSCMKEIRTDLDLLETYGSGKRATYLAHRLAQKITVLVQMCKVSATNLDKEQPVSSFHLEQISTRQQWLQSLQSDIDVLHAQRAAVKNRLQTLLIDGESPMQLSLQSELGEIERRLTLAEEAWAKAMST